MLQTAICCVILILVNVRPSLYGLKISISETMLKPSLYGFKISTGEKM